MNTPFTSIAAGLSLIFGFTFTTTTFEYALPEPRALNLELLAYNNDGTVSQRLSGGIPADWAAQIIRPVNGVDEVLCSGRGRGPNYRGETSTYTTNDWTFDECPELQAGDIGLASWEYVNESNTPVSIAGKFVVKD